MSGDAFGRVVAALGDRVKTQGREQVTARCPGPNHQHDDRNPSLSVADGGDRALLKCFTGCTPEEVVRALGLTMRELFDEERDQERRLASDNSQGGRGGLYPSDNSATPQHLGCTLAEYAAAKRLPIALLKAHGLTDITYKGAAAIRIPYLDADGHERAVRIRRALHKHSEHDHRFVWKRDSKVSLYGLDRLAQARSLKYIVMVEGESDTQTLWHYGIPAIGLPGAALYKDEWSGYLIGVETVYVVLEPDDGGAEVLKWLPKVSIRGRVRLVRLDGPKDVSDLHVADPDHFLARLQAAIDAAEPWAEHAKREAQAQTETAWSQCSVLATQRDILAELDASLTRRGVAGERRAACLVYLAVTSRIFDRPVSNAIRARHQAGSHTSSSRYSPTFRQRRTTS